MKTFYLPAKDAFVNHNTDAPVIAIKPFERGYYPIYTSATADDLNRGKYTPEVLESALSASMFGWNTPAARAAVDYIQSIEKTEATA